MGTVHRPPRAQVSEYAGDEEWRSRRHSDYCSDYLHSVSTFSCPLDRGFEFSAMPWTSRDFSRRWHRLRLIEDAREITPQLT
jgi:hypothetical protein